MQKHKWHQLHRLKLNQTTLCFTNCTLSFFKYICEISTNFNNLWYNISCRNRTLEVDKLTYLIYKLLAHYLGSAKNNFSPTLNSDFDQTAILSKHFHNICLL